MSPRFMAALCWGEEEGRGWVGGAQSNDMTAEQCLALYVNVSAICRDILPIRAFRSTRIYCRLVRQNRDSSYSEAEATQTLFSL